MIDPKKYGTVAEAAEIAGIGRTTLAEAVKRDDPRLVIEQTVGGTPLVSVKSAKKFKRKPPKRGPKPKKAKS